MLFCFYGYTQSVGSYKITTILNIKPGSGSYGGSCRNDVKINLVYESGEPITAIYEQLGSTSTGQYSVFTSENIVSSSRKPAKIQVYASRNWKRKIGGCGGNGSFNDDLKEGSLKTCTNTYSDIVKWWDDQLTIIYNPILVVVDPKEANDLATDKSTIIKSNTGFLPSEYNWQYSLNPFPSKDPESTDWINLPQYNGTSSFSANAIDILGDKTLDNIGNKIFFRQKACGIASEVVTYIVRLSAPKIDLETRTQPTCTDTDDATVKFISNRTLYVGEQLNFSLLDVTTNTPTDYSGALTIDSNKSFTLSGLRKGNYILQLIGYKDGVNTAVDADRYDLASFTIKSPPPLDFSLNVSNANCHGSQDGMIIISPIGGTREILGNDYYSLDNGTSWVPFPNNKPYTLTGLTPGTYKVKVKDMNGCIARVQTLVNGEIQLGEEKVIEATITQPSSPLALTYTYKQNPTFFGAYNGKITASISGGTIKDDKTYDYKWVKSTGEEFTAATQYNSNDKTYIISLQNAPVGEYKLTVTDKNYGTAVNKEGCSIIESVQVLTQPDPIAITLLETQSISCNTENIDTDIDKFSDGILSATVTGGTLPYQYIWSKFNVDTNVWGLLKDEKSNTLQNLTAGKYAVNVTDANGITQGIYNATDLVTANATIKELVEPVKLNLSFNSGNVSCYNGNNGWAIANVTGGMAPYIYQWYNINGGIVDNNKISQLTAGKYFVEVIDKKGCFTKGSILITEPQSAVAVEYEEILTPTFSGATNGRIVAKLTGGTSYDDQSYLYQWKNSKGVVQSPTTELKNGIYTITLDGIPADDYFLTVKDKNYEEAINQIINCSVLESKVMLNEPDPLKVVFEIVRTISCNASNEFGDEKDINPKDGQRDESQDGILTAHVTGGTPLAISANNGLPYYFYWKKQQPDGSWKTLTDVAGPTASNLSHGNYALNVKDRNGIMLGTYVNNVLTQEIDATQFLQEPPKLSVAITHGDVFCNGGNDGWAQAQVSGGTPPYEYNWSNDVETDKNAILKAGEYWIFVTDAKGCTTQESVTILEPAEPLTVKYTEILNPSFFKATNGKITVEIKGGTIFSNNSYWYEWKNSKGVLQKAITNFNNGVFTISLNGVPEETYTLNVHDANYDAAINKNGCSISSSVVTLDDPDPLEVTFEIVRAISCNVNNEFGNETDNNPQDNQRDESQDGILMAHVKGGIQLQENQNNGLPYYYTWKEKQMDGSFKILENKSETIENISEGTYALNIEDANGIRLGTYINNLLAKEVDVIQYMPQPEKLSLTFTKLNASCNNGDDGWAEAHVSGGTPPYTYEWTNGDATARIENITTNHYFLVVTDANGCMVQGNIFVGDPKGIFTTEEIKNPTCYKGSDGSIHLNVTGGNLPYSFLWNTGATTQNLDNLTEGNYEVTITCPDCCVYKKRFTLKNPDPIIVDLRGNRTLCGDQSLYLDASIVDEKAQYIWTSTNGFTSNEPKVNLTKAGTYHVKVTSSLGCVGEDDIVIKRSQDLISSEFLLSSQAYLDEEVILVNTSDPLGESTEWLVPSGVKIIDQKEKYITLQFSKIGTYTIGLKQTQGKCYALFDKDILVEKRSTLPNSESTSKFIKDFIVAPNPNDGNFKAIINLENNSTVNLRLFSTLGQYTLQKKDSGKKSYEIDFNTSLQSGMYILVLETEQQTLVKKIIIY